MTSTRSRQNRSSLFAGLGAGLVATFGLVLFAACDNDKNNSALDTPRAPIQAPVGDQPQGSGLPAPDTRHNVENFSQVIGWPEGRTPVAPEGFIVTRFAKALKSPRMIYVAANGDIFVSESRTLPKTPAGFPSANRITLLRDTNGDGTPDLQRVFLTGLNQPFGMLILGNYFYVGNTDGLYRFPYKAGASRITAAGEKILDLPAGGYNNHWTRNLIAKPDGSKIYISVGSGSNVGENGMENEVRRANILEINPDGTGERVLASGLRNPVGMGWSSGGTLWTAVNERDKLGDDLVPDYLTSVRDGGFYGWPYAYIGANEDPRLAGQRPDLVQKSIVPDVTLDSHSASLGLAFAASQTFPARFADGAYIGQHGSWNRTEFTGYKVKFVPFAGGTPTGAPEDFLSGFIADKPGQVYGRPVGVAFAKDGALLVADDASNIIWRVQAKE